MERKFRVGIIGGGGAIGQHHVMGFQASPYADVVAIAEISRQRAEETCRRFGVSDFHSNYRELLRRRDIHAISIALPNYLHAPVAIEALKAGKHVMLEKPMATCARDAARIVAAARRTRRVFMVGQNFRFTPDAQAIHRAVRRGVLGRVHHVRALFMRRSGIPRIGSWFTRRRLAGGGACYDLGVHLLDLGLHLMGNFDIVSVSGSVTGHLGKRGVGDGSWGRSEIGEKKIFDVDDHALALVKLRNGSTLYLEAAWAAFQEPNEIFRVELYGEKAGAHWFPAKIYRSGSEGFVAEQLAHKNLPYPTDRFLHFMECVALGKKPMVTPIESLQVQRALDAIDLSSKTGREIKL